MAQNFPKDLAEHLEAKISSLTVGTNLFYNTRLSDDESLPELIVCIYSTRPQKEKRCFGNKPTAVTYKKATIIIRGDNFSDNDNANEEAEDFIS